MARKPPPKPRRATKSAVQRKTALQMRTEGHTFEQIGQALGVSRQAAHAAVVRELAVVAEDRKALAGHVLDQELERIDYVMRSLRPKVDKGDPKAAQAFLAAMNRRAKLLGLDAPTRNEHTGPNGTPIPHLVAALDPAALHSRLAAAAARSARGADAGAARVAGADGTG